MDHVAIMNKSWKLIPKILSGEKTIESRWYQTKRSPWGKIMAGQTVYFKNSGEPVIAKAIVSEAMQFEINSIDDARDIVSKYGQEICLVDNNPARWRRLAKYCILIRLKNPERLATPFQIDKKGFGSGAAWIIVESIEKIKIKE
ncbi:MAG: hypothetical protein WC518_00835 [Patescibacteria group bacterium]